MNDDTNMISDLVAEWNISKQWVSGYTTDFPQLDTLADGIALNNVKNAPVVGDVTLASAVRQIPRSSVRQLPVFSAVVNGSKENNQAIFSSFLLRDKVFNEDTFGKGLLSTIQLGAESAITRGFQMYIANIGVMGEDFGTSMKQVYYDDFAVERGIFDFSDSTFFYVRTRVAKGRLKRLLAAAKENENTTWDVSALEELLEAGPGSTMYGETSSPARQEKGESASDNQFDIITKYGVGPFYDIEVFNPGIPRPLRKYKSKSKFGYPRLSAIVIDPAQLHPFGVSRARLASPMANYTNIYLQSTAKMQLINADPPVFQRGMFTTPVRLRRGVTWKSIDPNAEVKLQELSNSTMAQFESVMGFGQGQVLSAMGVGSAQNARRGSSAYQNKDAIQEDAAVRDLSVAQITAILENFLRQYALTSLDLLVSEQVGKEKVTVDDECKDKINELAERKFDYAPDPATGMPTRQFIPPIGDDNLFEVDWQEFYESVRKWTVVIDLSMGKAELEAKERADLQDAATVSAQTTNPNDPRAVARKEKIEDKLFEKMVPDMDLGGEGGEGMPPAAPPTAPGV